MLGEATELAADLGLTRLAASLPEVRAATASPHRSTKAGPAAPPRSGLRLEPEGDTWLVELGDVSVRMRDVRGLHYIARLVAEPEREIHALDLVGAGDGEAGGDAGEVLDANARAAYRRRLAELDEELREAEAWNDGARGARARSEIELLSSELSRAVGLGGRVRRAGSAAERARIAVTRRIRDLVKRAAEQSPELGRYLESTVRTGTYCVYRPM
jgi:hypothetical protein